MPATDTNSGDVIESSLKDGSIAETVESFVESTVKLAESLDAPEERLNDFKESGRELGHVVEGMAQEQNDQAEKIEQLEQRLDEQADHQARESANNRKRISAIEEREVDDSDDNPHPKGGQNTPPEPETSLEQVCALDDKTASRQLTSNQQRARFVAKNPTDYFSKVPAGYSLTSGEIGKVLRAGTDCDGHTATVDRVIGFLNKFGEGDVEVVKRRGTRRVIFSEEIVERLTRLSSRGCDAAEKGEV